MSSRPCHPFRPAPSRRGLGRSVPRLRESRPRRLAGPSCTRGGSAGSARWCRRQSTPRRSFRWPCKRLFLLHPVPCLFCIMAKNLCLRIELGTAYHIPTLPTLPTLPTTKHTHLVQTISVRSFSSVPQPFMLSTKNWLSLCAPFCIMQFMK